MVQINMNHGGSFENVLECKNSELVFEYLNISTHALVSIFHVWLQILVHVLQIQNH